MHFKVVMLVGLIISDFHQGAVRVGEKEIKKTGRGYYISPSGLDTNPGTRIAPFQSINKINTVSFIPAIPFFLKADNNLPAILCHM